jgi:hypothetical protein
MMTKLLRTIAATVASAAALSVAANSAGAVESSRALCYKPFSSVSACNSQCATYCSLFCPGGYPYCEYSWDTGQFSYCNCSLL